MPGSNWTPRRQQGIIIETLKLVVGCSWIKSKPIYRIVIAEWDRTPLCFHMHETEEEAKTCQDALDKLAERSIIPIVHLV